VTASRLDSFSALLAEAAQFRDERDWGQFHSPKNLAAAITIEAAELQEVLLWQQDDTTPLDPDLRRRLAEELADVLIHCANLALAVEIDIPQALAAKFKTNEAKYPVGKARGNARKYTEL
jgi:dCTP diphosphatase